MQKSTLLSKQNYIDTYNNTGCQIYYNENYIVVQILYLIKIDVYFRGLAIA